jgi:methylated-DNA-[protein]-cysteine S-methyltransferase
MLQHTFFDSPIGRLKLVANGDQLIAALWHDGQVGRGRLVESRQDDEAPILLKTRTELVEYFAGTRRVFDVPLLPRGTPFQVSVWRKLQAIPYGETRTYRSIAVSIGNSKAVRAVGAANSRNPVAILIPCHRVIGSSGKLTGFAGGLAAKQSLIDLESPIVRPSS